MDTNTFVIELQHSGTYHVKFAFAACDGFGAYDARKALGAEPLLDATCTPRGMNKPMVCNEEMARAFADLPHTRVGCGRDLRVAVPILPATIAGITWSFNADETRDSSRVVVDPEPFLAAVLQILKSDTVTIPLQPGTYGCLLDLAKQDNHVPADGTVGFYAHDGVVTVSLRRTHEDWCDNQGKPYTAANVPAKLVAELLPNAISELRTAATRGEECPADTSDDRLDPATLVAWYIARNPNCAVSCEVWPWHISIRNLRGRALDVRNVPGWPALREVLVGNGVARLDDYLYVR